MALSIGTWVPVTPMVGCQPITDTDTVQNHPFGTRIRAKDIGSTAYGEAEFIYVKGVTSGAARAWAVYNADDFTTTLATANTFGPLGIMVSALSASTTYGWLQIVGKAIGKCLTQYADDGYVYLTATAGSVDDASVAGDFIIGAKGASTAVVGDLHAEFEIHYPYAPQRVSVAG